MKRKFISAIALIAGVMLFVSPAAASSDDGWELVMDKNGIKAYSRPVKGSGIFEFRAVAVVDAPLEVVGEMLRDVPATSQWLPHCDNSYMVEMQDRNHFTTYISLDIPWPVKDRDLVLATSTEYDLEHGRAVTDLKNAIVASCPVKDDHIRMPTLTGQYVFEFVTRERTGIVHTYRADLAGNIPDFMINWATKYNIYKTFMGMKEMFKKKKYIEAGRRSPDKNIIVNIMEDKTHLKEIMVARLREFIKDTGFIDMILMDKNIDDVLVSDNGRTSETILYGWGSDKSKKKAISGILEAYLSTRTKDDELIKKILADQSLTNLILSGSGANGETSIQIIESWLNLGKGVGKTAINKKKEAGI